MESFHSLCFLKIAGRQSCRTSALEMGSFPFSERAVGQLSCPPGETCCWLKAGGREPSHLEN